jgi:PAS domain S-box-containing protein
MAIKTKSSVQYQYLPRFANYLLQHRLIDYIKEQIKIARQMDLPMLRATLEMSDEQIIEFAIPSNKEFLKYLAENKVTEFITATNNEWMQDRLSYAGKYDIVAEDITQGVFLRSKGLKKFIPDFIPAVNETMALVEEIDNFALASLTLATNTLLNLLRDKISQETHFSDRLLNTTPGIIFIFNLKNRTASYINQNIKDVLGYTPEDLIGMDEDALFKYAHPEDIPSVVALVDGIIKSEDNQTFELEYRFKHVNGTYKWMRTYVVVFRRDENGRPLEILGESFEITREKEIILTLARRDEQLIEAQNIANLGSFEWNFRDKTSNHSEQIYKIYEYTGERQFEDFIHNVHPDDQEKVRASFATSLVTGIYECEYRYLGHNKEKYLWTKGVVSYENGKPYKIVGTVQDISNRRKMEETLLQKTIELQKTNSDLSEFTYVASHDLKEPLRKISVFADLIYTKEYENLTVGGKEQLKKLVEATKRMRNLIDDILTISSVTANRTKERVNLQKIMDDVCSLLDVTIKQNTAVILSDSLPEAFVNPVLFNQLFLNLIGNSLKFSRKEVQPVIEITHAYLTREKIFTTDLAQASYLQLKFKDNGIGFSNDYTEKIFQLFGRLHPKSEYEGTGLGLSICKKIVEEHGGTITANGAPDKGATFTVIIPYEQVI